MALLLDRWLRCGLDHAIATKPYIELIVYVDFEAYGETPLATNQTIGSGIVADAVTGIVMRSLEIDPGRGLNQIKDTQTTKWFQTTTWSSMLVRVGANHLLIKLDTMCALTSLQSTRAGTDMQALKQSRTTPGQFANFKHQARAAVTDVAGSTM
eukprot:5278269-Pyramimonas_sp.AAC.1